jgi:hypothetical protein
MMDFDAVLEKKIKSFVEELHALVQQAAVESVRDALGMKGAGVARPRTKKAAKKAEEPPPKRAPKQGGKRTPEELARAVAKVRQHVQANPGHSIEQIGKAIGMPTKDLALPIIKLLKSGDVRKTGIKRNTKYFPGVAADALQKETAPKVAKKRSAKK